MKKILLLLVACFVFLPRAFCLDVPQPQGWVNDRAGVMDSASRNKAEALISGLEKQTGAEIAVLTIKSLEGENLEDYAVRVFEKWGIGKKDKDNGVLILFSLEDRKVKIETGYGVEGIIPDGLAGEIIRDGMIPYFKKGQYSNGLLAGIVFVAQLIAKDAGTELTIEGRRVAPLKRPKGKLTPLKLLFKIIFFIFMAMLFIRHPFLFLLLLSGGRGGGGGGGFGGGFGGFGGGMSGGGGGSGSW